MDNASAIAKLERLWDLDTGFLGRLRQGLFNEDDVDYVIELLDSLNNADQVIEKRLVSLIWYIPMYMEWQTERVKDAGGDAVKYERAKNRIQGAVQHCLGLP